MTIVEAREALRLALEDIAKSATEKQLTADVKCFIADHDLTELAPENFEKAALVAGEILVGAANSEEKLMLECALSVTDGEISSDEILREVNTVRESMKELCEKLDESENPSEAFLAVAPEEEIPEPAHTYDNKRFYIACGIGAAVLIALVLIIGAIF